MRRPFLVPGTPTVTWPAAREESARRARLHLQTPRWRRWIPRRAQPAVDVAVEAAALVRYLWRWVRPAAQARAARVTEVLVDAAFATPAYQDPHEHVMSKDELRRAVQAADDVAALGVEGAREAVWRARRPRLRAITTPRPSSVPGAYWRPFGGR